MTSLPAFCCSVLLKTMVIMYVFMYSFYFDFRGRGCHISGIRAGRTFRPVCYVVAVLLVHSNFVVLTIVLFLNRSQVLILGKYRTSWPVGMTVP